MWGENGDLRDRCLIGKKGEDIALEYLTSIGFSLLERNWRSGHREIDLIMMGDDGVHIVEVRSRNAPIIVLPIDTVGRKKQRLIIRAAASYIRFKGIDIDTHFDIVSIVFFENSFELEYVPDAFIPFDFYY